MRKVILIALCVMILSMGPLQALTVHAAPTPSVAAVNPATLEFVWKILALLLAACGVSVAGLAAVPDQDKLPIVNRFYNDVVTQFPGFSEIGEDGLTDWQRTELTKNFFGSTVGLMLMNQLLAIGDSNLIQAVKDWVTGNVSNGNLELVVAPHTLNYGDIPATTIAGIPSFATIVPYGTTMDTSKATDYHLIDNVYLRVTGHNQIDYGRVNYHADLVKNGVVVASVFLSNSVQGVNNPLRLWVKLAQGITTFEFAAQGFARSINVAQYAHIFSNTATGEEGETKVLPYPGVISPDAPIPNTMTFPIPAAWPLPWTESIPNSIGITIPQEMIDQLIDTLNPPQEGVDTAPIDPALPWEPPAIKDLQLPIAISTKFPFSIPWDIHRLFSALTSTGTAPRWETQVKLGALYTGTVVIDLAPYNDVAAIVRALCMAIFVLCLVVATRRLIGAN